MISTSEVEQDYIFSQKRNTSETHSISNVFELIEYLIDSLEEYLSKVQSEQGFVSDVEYYLLKSIELIKATPKNKKKRLRILVCQIKGQFEEKVISINPLFDNKNYFLSKGSPRKVLELCEKIDTAIEQEIEMERT